MKYSEKIYLPQSLGAVGRGSSYGILGAGLNEEGKKAARANT